MDNIPSNEIKSIMVVDDSALQRAHAVELFHKLGIATTHQASDGNDALSQLRSMESLPDVVVVDLEMPGMDGIEMIQHMHKADMLIPLVIASGRDEALLNSAARMIDAWGLPLLGIAPKPLKLESLGDVLSNFAP